MQCNVPLGQKHKPATRHTQHLQSQFHRSADSVKTEDELN